MMANNGLLRSINIIPKNAVWNPGYVNSSNGNITPPDSESKERYTTFDYDASIYRYLVAFGRYNVSNGVWVGIGTYKADGTFINRPSITTTSFLVGNVYYWLTSALQISSDTKRITVSFRTYGDADIVLVDIADFMALCKSNGVSNYVQA